MPLTAHIHILFRLIYYSFFFRFKYIHKAPPWDRKHSIRFHSRHFQNGRGNIHKADRIIYPAFSRKTFRITNCERNMYPIFKTIGFCPGKRHAIICRYYNNCIIEFTYWIQIFQHFRQMRISPFYFYGIVQHIPSHFFRIGKKTGDIYLIEAFSIALPWTFFIDAMRLGSSIPKIKRLSVFTLLHEGTEILIIVRQSNSFSRT